MSMVRNQMKDVKPAPIFLHLTVCVRKPQNAELSGHQQSMYLQSKFCLEEGNDGANDRIRPLLQPPISPHQSRSYQVLIFGGGGWKQELESPSHHRHSVVVHLQSPDHPHRPVPREDERFFCEALTHVGASSWLRQKANHIEYAG